MSENEPMIAISEKRYMHLIQVEKKLDEIVDDLRYAVETNVENAEMYAGDKYVTILVNEIKRLKASAI